MSNKVESNPFEDVVYLLGGEEVFQYVAKEGLVGLDTLVDCGPVKFEFFADDNSATVGLDEAYFTVSDPDDIDSEYITFLVN